MCRVAIVGAGVIGKAWAVVFAQAGFVVSLWDPDRKIRQEAISAIRVLLQDMQRYRLLDEQEEAVLARIEICDSLSQTVSQADYVQENGPEKLHIRKTLFAELDAATRPDTILASSTSGMPASTFTESLSGRDRCIIAHAPNPPYLLPLVELCPSPWTAEETVQRSREIMLAASREPAVLRQEVNGFALNRLQSALIREAFELVADGAISPAELDTVVTQGLGMRWSFMGPFETVDLNAPGGLGDFFERYGGLYQSLQRDDSTRAWNTSLIKCVEAERRRILPLSEIAERQRWRDRQLMALAAYMKNREEK